MVESGILTKEQKKKLQKVYESLNPAELKRQIDTKLKDLYKVYQKKNGSLLVERSRIKTKKIVPTMVSYYMTQP